MPTGDFKCDECGNWTSICRCYEKRMFNINKLSIKEEVYFYDVGYYSYEEAPSIMIFHNKKFTEKEFRDLCASITANIYKNRHQIKDMYYRNEKLKTGVRFEDLLGPLIDELCKNYGFDIIKTTASFSPSGHDNVDYLEDWEEEAGAGYEGGDLHTIREKISNTRVLLIEKITVS